MHSMQVMKVIQAVHKLQVMRAIPVMKVMKVREGLKKWLFFMTFAIKRGRGSGAPLSFFFKYCFSSHAESFMASKNMFSA